MCKVSNQSTDSPVRAHTKSAVIVKNQLVLLDFSFIFVCRCKWVLDIAGKLARRQLVGHLQLHYHLSGSRFRDL